MPINFDITQYPKVLVVASRIAESMCEGCIVVRERILCKSSVLNGQEWISLLS